MNDPRRHITHAYSGRLAPRAEAPQRSATGQHSIMEPQEGPSITSKLRGDLEALGTFVWGEKPSRSSDRLSRYIRALDILENKGFSSEEEDAEELVWAAIEGAELGEIFRSLNSYRPSIIRPLLRRALSGSSSPISETTSSNFARNLAFELLLASRFRASGLSIKLGSQTDLIVKEGGLALLFECKRPFSRRQVRARIVEAKKQLQKGLARWPEGMAAGIIAVSATRILNPGHLCLTVKQAADLHSTLDVELTSLNREFASDFEELIDLRIAGVLWHANMPILIEAEEQLASSSEFAFFAARGAPLRVRSFSRLLHLMAHSLGKGNIFPHRGW